MSAELATLAHEVSQAQPPAQRERDIFAAITQDHKPAAEVARIFGVSLTDIPKIVGLVAEWLVRHEPEMESGLSGKEAARLATRIAKTEFARLFVRAETGWEASLKEKVTTKERRFQEEFWQEKTVQNQCGKVGYISSLHRIILAQARLEGVDVSGLSIRKAALAENAAQEKQKQSVKPLGANGSLSGGAGEGGGAAPNLHQESVHSPPARAAKSADHEPENRLSDSKNPALGKLGNSWGQPENRLSPSIERSLGNLGKTLHQPENRLSRGEQQRELVASAAPP